MHEPVEVDVDVLVDVDDEEEVVLEVDDVLVVLTHSLALPSVGS